MTTSSSRHCRYLAAFTLAELLVAISITALVVVLLSRVFAATSSQWQAADQRIDAFRDARMALNVISRDLSRSQINGDARMLTLTDGAGSGVFAQEAFAVTPTPNSGKSDLCAVGYYCAWDSATKTFTLKRLLRESDAALPLLQTLNFTSLYAKDHALEEDVAAYAWDLRFYVGVNNDIVPLATAGPSTDWHWVEARFKAMSPAAGRKIRDSAMLQGDWQNPASDIYKRLILPNEQQFVTRIALEQNR